jgi:hypothetical protein
MGDTKLHDAVSAAEGEASSPASERLRGGYPDPQRGSA